MISSVSRTSRTTSSGVPARERHDLEVPGHREEMLERYEHEMLPKHRDTLDQAAALVREAPSALVCLEADYRRCHRGRLARVLSSMTGLPVEHLTTADAGAVPEKMPEAA